MNGVATHLPGTVRHVPEVVSKRCTNGGGKVLVGLLMLGTLDKVEAAERRCAGVAHAAVQASLFCKGPASFIVTDAVAPTILSPSLGLHAPSLAQALSWPSSRCPSSFVTPYLLAGCGTSAQLRRMWAATPSRLQQNLSHDKIKFQYTITSGIRRATNSDTLASCTIRRSASDPHACQRPYSRLDWRRKQSR